MALGEARSKCQHLAGVPLTPESAQLLHQIFLARGALATTAIEGNTLSEKQALDIVQQKSDLPESQSYLRQEIQNIVAASNNILSAIESGTLAPLTVQDIKGYNKLILRGLTVGTHVIPGECVKTDVSVAGYHGAPWQECEELLQSLVSWLNSREFQEVY
jgi:Fic family protein